MSDSASGTNACQIAAYLSKGLTAQGILDPDEQRVLAHSYTTDFYAWLCALLYRQDHGKIWLDRATTAVGAALQMMDEWRAQFVQTGDKASFHWEFKNMALLHVEQIIGDKLPDALLEALSQSLLKWCDLNIDSANWTAMRMVTYQMRYARFGRRRDQWRSKLELQLLLSMQTPEGFFPDRPDSRSMQYHAYVLALLVLYYRNNRLGSVRSALLRGVRFIVDFIDPQGDFNYFGRGQRQLFGYASLIFALGEAAALCADHDESQCYRFLQANVLKFVHQFRQASGLYPIVLNDVSGPWGKYDYNNTGDYLAFFAVFSLLSNEQFEHPRPGWAPERQGIKCYPRIGLAVVHRPEWFGVFSSCSRDLSEPIGLIHLWPSGVTSLGGPSQERSNGIDYGGNYNGPLINGEPVLWGLTGKMRCRPYSVQISVASELLDSIQVYDWSDGLRLKHTLIPRAGATTVTPQTFVGGSIPATDIELHYGRTVASPIGLRVRYEGREVPLSGPLTYRVKWIRSSTRARASICPLSSKGNSSSGWLSRQYIRIWKRVLKVIWVLWVTPKQISRARIRAGSGG